MKEQDKYLILIHKRLTKQLSSEEAHDLDAWLQSNPEHQALYETTAESWEQSQEYKADYQPDTSKAWNKLNEKMSTPEIVRMPIRRRWLAAAAAILLLMGGAFLYLNNMKAVAENWVEIQTNETTKEVTLPDGSTVSLNKNTRLAYRENFNDNKERNLKMTGEAFFDVTKNTKPFVVQTERANVRVLGTSFNVKSNTDDTEITVKSGKVQVSNKSNTQKFVLQKGEKAIADKSGKVQKSTPKTLNDIAWKTRRLDFNGTPLEDVVRDLETYFNVNIDATQLKFKCLHSGDVIEGDKIEDVLNNLKTLHKIKVSKTANRYAISGGSC